MKFCFCLCLVMFSFWTCSLYPLLQSKVPPPYFSFKEPTEALSIAKRYLPGNPVIIDAGAFDGAESIVMSQVWPQGHLHAFEPVPEIFKSLAEKTRPFSNISAYNLALGTTDGMCEMYVSEFVNAPGSASHSSSLLPPKEVYEYAPHVAFPRTVTVNACKLDTWAQNNHIEKIDMLWLDMQGFELDMMKASPIILSTVKVILTEVEFVEAYQDQYLYQDIKDWLEGQGFVLIGGNFNPLAPRNHPTKYCGDALFVRKELL